MGMEGQPHAPDTSTTGKDPLPIVKEAGWAPRPVWTGGKPRPHRDSIPDRRKILHGVKIWYWNLVTNDVESTWFWLIWYVSISLCLLILTQDNFLYSTQLLFTLTLLKPTGYVMHHQFNIQQLYVLPTLYLCVLYLSENKLRLVPLTA